MQVQSGGDERAADDDGGGLQRAGHLLPHSQVDHAYLNQRGSRSLLRLIILAHTEPPPQGFKRGD